MNTRDQYAHEKAAREGVPGGHDLNSVSEDADLFSGLVEALLILIGVVATIIGLVSL